MSTKNQTPKTPNWRDDYRVNFVLFDESSGKKDNSDNHNLEHQSIDSEWHFDSQETLKNNEEVVNSFVSPEGGIPKTTKIPESETGVLLEELKRYQEVLIKNSRPQTSKMNTVFNFIIFIFLVFNSWILLNNRSISFENISTSGESQVVRQALGASDNSQIEDKPKVGRKVISKFKNNESFVELGHRIVLTDTAIQSSDHPSCQTPTQPPVNNGCNFTFDIFSNGIPLRGVVFNSLEIKGDIPGDSQLIISTKDYQSGQIGAAPLATLSRKDITEKVVLPENIPTTTGLFFNIWSKDGVVKIDQIIINYFTLDTLQVVSGELNNIREDYSSAKIYHDVNENRVFEPGLDRVWDCRPNFAGVRKVNIKEDGKFELERDEDCFIDVKPDDWYEDNYTLSLPPGQWIMVFGEDEYEIFEVRAVDNGEAEINFLNKP